MTGTEARQTRLHTEVAEQGAVVHPVENALLPGLEPGRRPGRQHEHIAALPGQGEGAAVAIARPRQRTAPPQHREQGRGRHRGRAEGLTGKNAQEVGGQGGAGGWSRATQRAAEVQWQDGRGALGVEVGAPLVQADRLGETGAYRVGCLAVVEPESRCLPAFAHLRPGGVCRARFGSGCRCHRRFPRFDDALGVAPRREGARGDCGVAHGFRASERQQAQ